MGLLGLFETGVSVFSGIGVPGERAEQRRPRPRDRAYLAGLSRGGRTPTLDSTAGQRHRAGGRVCGGLGDDPRREMDFRPLVAHRGVWSSDLSADFTLIFVKNRMSAIVLSG